MTVNSGPCCPNGHVYGWKVHHLNDTTPLRKVEVTSDGHVVQPFQINELLSTLQEVYPKTSSPVDDAPYTIWMMGDSTMKQVFFGFLCALIRIGGLVEQCDNTIPTHYRHPLCNRTQQLELQSLDKNTTDNVMQEQAGVRLPNGRLFQIRHFDDNMFCHMQRSTEHCQAYESRFQKLVETQEHQPDIFLVNSGLHMYSKQMMRHAIEHMFNNLLLPYTDKISWRETTVTHFPDTEHTGQYERWKHDRGLNRTDTISCTSIRQQFDFWRQETARDWLTNNYKNATGIDIPILSMNETEMRMFETYPLLFPGQGEPDCVHHIYTPLYWDSFFWRLSQLIRVRQSGNLYGITLLEALSVSQ